MSGFILRGEVFLTRVNKKGVPLGGAVGPVNAEELSLEPDVSEILRTSNNKPTYGKSLGKVQDAQPTKVKLKFDEIEAKVLAETLGAELSELNAAPVNAVAKAITLHGDGSWTPLGAKQITETGFAVNNGGAEPLTLNTDYEVHWAGGLIRPLKGGALEAGGDVTVDFQSLARAGSSITGGEVQEVNWHISLVGENVDTNEAIALDIPLAQMSSSGAINLLQNEFMSPEFEGVASVASGKAYDYKMDVVDPA